MSEPDDSNPSPPRQPAAPELNGLDPGELIARGLNTVHETGGPSHWTPPAPAELARLLPHYHIESMLGHGGMGAVYKGLQPDLDRPVAIKLLPAELTADEQFIGRFRREARSLAKLHHPGIVTVYDFGQTSEGHLYFVMEYVDGADLRRVLQTTHLEPDQALELVCQVCEALQAAHKLGIIHRDIKPANILLTSDGVAKLADFGLCRPVGEINTAGLSNSDIAMGTLDYMSPEQRSGHSDHRTDIFSLGITLYEMLTGRPPRGAFDPPSRKVRIDVRLDEVVLKALQEEPDRRYQQASEMKMDVDRIRTSTAEPVAPVLAPAAKPAPRRSLAPVAVVTLLILGSAGFFAWKKYGPQTAANAPATVNAQVLDWSPTQQTPAILQAANPEQTPAPVPAGQNDNGGHAVSPGMVISTLAGSAGNPGFIDGAGSAARFNKPDGLAIDGSGNLYVVDQVNFAVRKVTPGGIVKTLAGTGGPGFANGTPGQFERPTSLAVDSGGNVYVADINHIRKVAPGGGVTTFAGGKAGDGSQDGPADVAQFYIIGGVAMDGKGNVYVADQGNNNICKITPQGMVTTLAGLAGAAGNIDGPGSEARFNKPTGLAVDAGGNLYVTEIGVNDDIRKITPKGVVTTLARLKDPDVQGVAVDGSGNVYVSSGHDQFILRITPDGVVTPVAGGKRGSKDGKGSEAQFAKPIGLAVDSKGNVYVADNYNHTIRKLTPSGDK